MIPQIIPSADLRNKYTQVSDFCHETGEPVVVTKSGKGDLVVMSIEAFDMMEGDSHMSGFEFDEDGEIKICDEEVAEK